MIRIALATALLSNVVVAAHAEVRVTRHPSFLTSLDRNGYLSAGWVQVLPVLATACNLRLDNAELTDRLVDLSRQEGNVGYTAHLYTTLYNIEYHRAGNNFVQAWSTRFNGRQQEACETAAALWGDNGRQFPGVLKREASNDGVGQVPPAPPAADGK